VSLDLAKVTPQVEGMVGRLKTGAEERRRQLDYARHVLSERSADLEPLKEKIAASKGKTTWLVAGLTEQPDRHYPAPPVPGEFTVLATDGSHIDVDRNRPARCYLINIGAAILRYGASPQAILDSVPNLYADDRELVIAPTADKGREQPVEGSLLGIKRSVDECSRLAEVAANLPQDIPSLALIDGSLILWGLEAFPEFVTEVLLVKVFLSRLDELKKLSSDRRLALASYISLPRSTDVVNVLRLAVCPHEAADCDHFCPSGNRACDVVGGVQDRELFSSLLAPGERSAVFANQSFIVEKHYGTHRVHFFYLRVDDEIARVEVPRWVATDGDLLNLTHVLVLDQCRRGQGYPVALSEAHEQAVVREADKQSFWQLVESLLAEGKLPALTSAKSRSKRTRWV
jgi:hypothetical protein